MTYQLLRLKPGQLEDIVRSEAMIDLVISFLEGHPIEIQVDGKDKVIIPSRPYPDVTNLLRTWLEQEGYSKRGEANTQRYGSMKPTDNDIDQPTSVPEASWDGI